MTLVETTPVDVPTENANGARRRRCIVATERD
jgi:hypothetical protein